MNWLASAAGKRDRSLYRSLASPLLCVEFVGVCVGVGANLANLLLAGSEGSCTLHAILAQNIHARRPHTTTQTQTETLTLYLSISRSLSLTTCARSLPHTLHTPLIIISSSDGKLSDGVEITCADAEALGLGRTVNMPEPRQPKRNLHSPYAQPRRHVPDYSRTPLAHAVALWTSDAIALSPARRMHTRDQHGRH